jgi:hypothetical protein
VSTNSPLAVYWINNQFKLTNTNAMTLTLHLYNGDSSVPNTGPCDQPWPGTQLVQSFSLSSQTISTYVDAALIKITPTQELANIIATSNSFFFQITSNIVNDICIVGPLTASVTKFTIGMQFYSK